jgi:epoxyqueuosine reductase
MRAPLGDQVYGCDICQDVCPWNRGVERRRAGTGAVARGGRAAVDLREWLTAEPSDLRRRYERLFVPRHDGRLLQRNALVALGNTGTRAQRGWAEPFLGGDDELLREHAAWAVAEIDARDD